MTMGKNDDTVWSSALFRRSLGNWRQAAKSADKAPLDILRRQRSRARQLRDELDYLIRAADERLALPADGNDRFPLPHNCDWSWRPDIWRTRLNERGHTSVESGLRLDAGVALFHDCDLHQMSLRQVRNHHPEDLAAYGLSLDVFEFEGSFLSLAIDMPAAAMLSLRHDHVIRVGTIVEMERLLEIFVRLNIRQGPNTEQMVREVAFEEDEAMVEFDLALSNLNAHRIEKAWIDLIFENPQMNAVTLRDLTFARFPRAPL
ncbi:MAG: DUF6478 family protein [Pseudomonadota bacterium]